MVPRCWRESKLYFWLTWHKRLSFFGLHGSIVYELCMFSRTRKFYGGGLWPTRSPAKSYSIWVVFGSLSLFLFLSLSLILSNKMDNRKKFCTNQELNPRYLRDWWESTPSSHENLLDILSFALTHVLMSWRTHKASRHQERHDKRFQKRWRSLWTLWSNILFFND